MPQIIFSVRHVKRRRVCVLIRSIYSFMNKFGEYPRLAFSSGLRESLFVRDVKEHERKKRGDFESKEEPDLLSNLSASEILMQVMKT